MRCGREVEKGWVREAGRVGREIERVVGERRTKACREREEAARGEGLPEALSRIFRLVRKAEGLTQAEMGKRCGGASAHWVVRAEREQAWSLKNICRAAQGMGIPARVFVQWGLVAVGNG